MKKKRYDVVVVGCGPGGATAGKFAALNGAETLVIEQKRQIGFPVFDAMSIISSQSEMEEATGEMIEPAAVYSRIEGLRYISLSGKEGKPYALHDGVFVNRQLFEKSLAIAAVRAGAEIMLHTRVVDVVKEGGGVRGVIIKTVAGLTAIPCSVVIAADGSCKHVARSAGFDVSNPKISISLGCEFVGARSLRKPHNIDEIYLANPEEGMYRYVAPYEADRISVGCGVKWDNVKQKKSLKQGLNEFMSHLALTGKYDFSRAAPVNMMCGGAALVTMGASHKLASDGIILIGDAASRPQFGCRWGAGGMLKACWTGRVAGEIAARAVKKGDVSEKRLDGEYRNAIGNTFKEGEREKVQEALNAWNKMYALGPQEQERAVADIGWEIAALHFHCRGGTAAPLPSSLEPAQRWLKEMERGR